MSRGGPGARRLSTAPSALLAALLQSCGPAPPLPAPLVDLGDLGATPPTPAVRELPPGPEGQRERTPAARMRWETDPSMALRRARAEGRPLLVFVCAAWAARCARLDREVFRDGEVLETGARFVALRLDLSDGDEAKAELARRLGVGSVPGVALRRADGAGPAESVPHPIERAGLLEAMRRVP